MSKILAHLSSFFLFLTLFFFVGCSATIPVSWKARILNAQVPAQTLIYDEYGERSKPTLLFLHGFGENRYTWRFLVPKLAQKYHLFLLDLKGFGDSPKSRDGFYSAYDQAYLVNNFIKKKNLKNITLVGRSFGGGVALILALMQKDKLIEKNIKKMILINSMIYKQNLPSMMEVLNKPIIGWLGIYLIENRYIVKEGYRYGFFNDALIPKESIDYAAAYLSFPNAKYAYLETVNQLVPEDLEVLEKRYKEITLPTLILWGKQDVAISVKKAYRLNHELPHSQIEIFEKAGHLPQEEVPKLVNKAIEKFMEERQ